VPSKRTNPKREIGKKFSPSAETQKPIKATIPSHLQSDINLLAFRFCAKAPMVGYREGNVFHVVWLDRAFTLYDH
jgi:hypothetical protein